MKMTSEAEITSIHLITDEQNDGIDQKETNPGSKWTTTTLVDGRRHRGLSPHCIATTSKLMIIVSTIFALIESALMLHFAIDTFYKQGFALHWGVLILLVITVAVVTGQVFRIRVVWRWWAELPSQASSSSQEELKRSHEATQKCLCHSLLITLLIQCPLIFFILSIFAMHHGGVADSLALFIFVSLIDTIIFIPFCALPAAVGNTSFWNNHNQDDILNEGNV